MDKALSIADFDGVKAGTMMPVYYAGTNVGRFILRYEGIVTRNGKRFIRCEITDENDGTLPSDEYLYEFEGDVCMNSSADRVYSGWPNLDDLWRSVELGYYS